ncbi:hypothetical protein ACIOD2_27175 [Amycolatopsis sp. NPDC088138]|uniref:hypothetical protein n=1 Tax=Amycolatopsis sp. NPDC088138 TaxID=3363938 RepID=UPI0038205B6E
MNKKWRWTIGISSVVIVLVVLTIIKIGTTQGAKPDWYSAWASAASSLIALIALVAAAVAANATIQTNKTQTRQLAKLEETQQSDRASKFAVWRALHPTRDSQIYRTFFHNAGPLPMYDVIIHYFVNGHEYTSKEETLPPTSTPELVKKSDNNLEWFIKKLAIEEYGLYQPKTKEEVAAIADLKKRAEAENVRIELVRAINEGKNRYVKDIRIETGVSFSDGENTWYRAPNGRLERTS